MILLGIGFELCAGFVLVVLAAYAVFYTLSIYNGLIELRNNIDKAWANIDVLLKQRSDLIPNLVETVKGYMKHERDLLAHITQIRADIMKSKGVHEKAELNEDLSASLKSLFAVSENYPKLRASENFLELQKQLSSIENQIADRREFFNNSVLLYNTRIQSIPDNVVALFLGFKKKEYFKASEEDKKEVKVQL